MKNEEKALQLGYLIKVAEIFDFDPSDWRSYVTGGLTEPAQRAYGTTVGAAGLGGLGSMLGLSRGWGAKGAIPAGIIGALLGGAYGYKSPEIQKAVGLRDKSFSEKAKDLIS